MTEKNILEKTCKINDTISLNVDSFLSLCMRSAISQNAVHISGFDTDNIFYWSQNQETFDYTTMTYLDYAYFKAKEYVINTLLLEATIIFDSEDGLYTKLYDILHNYLILNESDFNKKKNDPMHRHMVIDDNDYYKDLRNFIKDIKKKLSPDSITEEKISSETLGTLEHYFRYLNRTSHPKSEQLQRLGFPLRENPYYHFQKTCTEKTSPTLFENSLLFMHFLLEDQKDLLSSTYFPYIGILSAHFKGKYSLDDRCVSFIHKYDTEGKKHGNSNKIFKDVCEKYDNLYSEIQDSLKSIQTNYGSQSYNYAANAFMFNNLTHVRFFKALPQSTLYSFFEKKIDFMGLMHACQEDTSNSTEVNNRSELSESLFYIQLLEKMMTFDVDLQFLDKLNFHSQLSTAGLPKEYEFLIISLALKTVYDFLNEVHSAMGPLLKHLLKLIKCAFPLRSATESKQILNSITSQLNTFSKQLVLEDSTQTADLRVFDAESGEKYKLIVAYLLNSSCGNRIIQI